jgi:hypothetical protein
MTELILYNFWIGAERSLVPSVLILVSLKRRMVHTMIEIDVFGVKQKVLSKSVAQWLDYATHGTFLKDARRL